MPAPLKVDWDIARALFLGGLSISDVAHKTGISFVALKQKAHRNKWRERLSKQAVTDACHGVTDPVTKTVTSVTVEDAQAMLRSSNAWKHRIIRLTERHIAAVEARDPETLKLQDFETLARIADTTDKIARRSFGLDVAQNQTAHLMVHVQSDLSAGAPVKQLPAPRDVIDVESTPVLSTEVAPRE